MNLTREIRHQLKNLGFSSHIKQDIESLGVELTICQFIVVVLSIISVVFLFVPFFYLKDIKFMLIFFGVSLLSLSGGIWFWVHRSEICENPEDYVD